MSRLKLFALLLLLVSTESQKRGMGRGSGAGRLNVGNTTRVRSKGEIEVMRLDAFPRNEIAMHFSCPESNMFATNCACHLRCRDGRTCSDAVAICEKYKTSHGCRYVLLRGGASNAIATLKRVPTEQELRSLDLSQYPTSMQKLQASPKWSALRESARRKRAPSGPMVGDLVRVSGPAGDRLLTTLRGQGPSKQAHCISRGDTTRLSNATWKRSLLTGSITLVALSYQSPRTLLNSMRSWNSSGLLGMVSERLAILSDPLPQDLAIASEHGFRIIEPRDIPNVRVSKPNTLTIGAAFYYALREATSDYVLFLENDFKMDTSLPLKRVALELVSAVGMLDRGAELVRLLSRKQQGCGTFKSCDHGGIHLDSSNMMERRRNWFAFYCPEDTTEHRGQVYRHMSVCLREPEMRCFTSWDSNWSLNAALVKRKSMLEKKYPIGDADEGGGAVSQSKSIAEIGLEQYANNDGFESTMSWGVRWMRWRVPLCISYDGLFLHEEIETGA